MYQSLGHERIPISRSNLETKDIFNPVKIYPYPFSFDVSQCCVHTFVVLLLGARVAASAAAISKADEEKAWLILAWVSTIAGNFSLLGSAANLIVCEQARRAPNLGYNLTFWTHLKFGLPSTLIVTAIGLTLIR